MRSCCCALRSGADLQRGLSDYVDDDAIADVLRPARTPPKPGAQLVKLDARRRRSGQRDGGHRGRDRGLSVEATFPSPRLSGAAHTSPGMAYDVQISVDCVDPHVLAEWWAETLKWVVETSDEAFIQKMLDDGLASDDDVSIYKGTVVWKTAAAIRHPDDPERGPRRRVLFQTVPEPKTVKNRLHFNVNVGPGNVESELEQIVARGGAFLYRGQQGPQSWVTMADPEGNEFCIQY